MSFEDLQAPRHQMKWKALAFESEMISKAVLTKEFLPEDLWKSYRDQILRLKHRMEKLSQGKSSSLHEHLQEKFSKIEGRLKFLNPENRIQINFEFFTKKIHYFKNRLDFLNQSLETLDKGYSHLGTIQSKRAQVEKEITLLEKSLTDVHMQREALLA